jgi:ribosomal protein S18 acetylase RimI-like enzyme
MNVSVELVLIETQAEVGQLELFAAEIWREYYPHIIGAAKVEYMLKKFQTIEAFLALIKEGMKLYWIDVKGEHAGYAAIKRQENTYLFISKFYVHQRFRGMGIGKSAMKLFSAKATEMHLDGLKLTVNKNNDSAVSFYEALGFENILSQKVDIGGGFYMDDYVMRLEGSIS